MAAQVRVSDVEPFPLGTGPGRPRTGRGLTLAVAAAMVAAATAVDRSGLRPFTTLRWWVVSSAVCVAAGLALWDRRRTAHPVTPLPRWFTVAFAALVAALVVAALVTGEADVAWLGHPQRHLGVLAWLVFAAAAVAGAAVAHDPRHERAVAVGATVAGATLGAGAAVDLLGWSPLGRDFADGRVGGLLGQPTTLAALAVLLLPVVASARHVGRVRWPVVGGLVLAIAGAQTRGAVLGLLVAAAVSAPAWRHRVRGRHLGWLAAAVVVVVVSPFGDRLRHTPDSSRVDEWQVALDVLAEHPWIGVGPEGYRSAVVGSLDEDYVEDHGRDVVIDRAHSAPLDVALAGGLPAGAAYTVLIAGVAVATWRRHQQEPWSPAAAAGTGAVGLLAAGLVAFPVPEVDALAWLFAGWCLTAPTSRPTRARGAPQRLVTAVGVPAAGALLAVAAVAGATDTAADRWLGAATDLAARGRASEGLALADRATDLRPDLVDGWYVSAQVASAGPSLLDLDAGIERAVAGLTRDPGDPALRVLHARLVTERALRSELDQDLGRARAVVAAARREDPTHPVLEDLGRVLDDRGRPGAAP